MPKPRDPMCKKWGGSASVGLTSEPGCYQGREAGTLGLVRARWAAGQFMHRLNHRQIAKDGAVARCPRLRPSTQTRQELTANALRTVLPRAAGVITEPCLHPKAQRTAKRGRAVPLDRMPDNRRLPPEEPDRELRAAVFT